MISEVSHVCVRSILSLLANNVDPDQMPHHVTSDLGLHFDPFYKFRSKKGLTTQKY